MTKLVSYLITVHDVYIWVIVYVLLLSRMSLMVFHRFGVVGVSSPGDRRLGGKSRENRFFKSGFSVVEERRLLSLLFVAELISPSSKTLSEYPKNEILTQYSELCWLSGYVNMAHNKQNPMYLSILLKYPVSISHITIA